jgi:hypothetical protein
VSVQNRAECALEEKETTKRSRLLSTRRTLRLEDWQMFVIWKYIPNRSRTVHCIKDAGEQLMSVVHLCLTRLQRLVRY